MSVLPPGVPPSKKSRTAWAVSIVTVVVAIAAMPFLWQIDGEPPDDDWMRPVWVSVEEREGNPLAQLQSWLEENPISFSVGGVGESWDQARARQGLGKYAGHLSQFDRLMSTDPETWYWIEGPESATAIAPNVELNGLTSLVNLQASRSRAAPKGDEAIKQALLLVKMAKGLSRAQGSALQVLVASTALQIGLQALERAVKRIDVGEGDLKVAAQALEGQQIDQRDAAFGMKVDYEWFRNILLRSAKGEISVVEGYEGPQIRGLVKPDLALRRYVEIYGPVIRVSDGGGGEIRSVLEKNQKDVSRLYDQKYRNLFTGGTGTVLLLLAAPVADLFVASILDSNAQLAVAQVQLALRQYELSTGRLPEHLDEITALLSAEATKDPWATGPLLWNSKTKKLYSKGRNGRDDDGQIERVEKKKKPLDIGAVYWWSEK